MGNQIKVDAVAELMKGFVKLIIDEPQKVVVNSYEGAGWFIEVVVKDSDYGKLIGKGGRIAQALRVIVSAVGGKVGKKVSISFLTESGKMNPVPDNKAVPVQDAGYKRI